MDTNSKGLGEWHMKQIDNNVHTFYMNNEAHQRVSGPQEPRSQKTKLEKTKAAVKRRSSVSDTANRVLPKSA